jgi:hypothetical protein
VHTVNENVSKMAIKSVRKIAATNKQKLLFLQQQNVKVAYKNKN